MKDKFQFYGMEKSTLEAELSKLRQQKTELQEINKLKEQIKEEKRFVEELTPKKPKKFLWFTIERGDEP